MYFFTHRLGKNGSNFMNSCNTFLICISLHFLIDWLFLKKTIPLCQNMLIVVPLFHINFILSINATTTYFVWLHLLPLETFPCYENSLIIDWFHFSNFLLPHLPNTCQNCFHGICNNIQGVKSLKIVFIDILFN